MRKPANPFTINSEGYYWFALANAIRKLRPWPSNSPQSKKGPLEPNGSLECLRNSIIMIHGMRYSTQMYQYPPPHFHHQNARTSNSSHQLHQLMPPAPRRFAKLPWAFHRLPRLVPATAPPASGRPRGCVGTPSVPGLDLRGAHFCGGKAAWHTPEI